MLRLKMMILGLVICSVCVFDFPGVTEAGAAEPSVAQCQGEPARGTGWGTFWMVYGMLNVAGGAAMVSSPDSYDFENPRGVGIGAIVVGGVLSGLGLNMRHSANEYNKTCAKLLSGVSLEPIERGGTGLKLTYRW